MNKKNLYEYIGMDFYPFHKIVNCTPHTVTVFMPKDGHEIYFPASGTVARVEVTQNQSFCVEGRGIPVWEEKLGDTVDLPEYREDTLLIVSRLVAEANPSRGDLLYPTALVRDDRGRVLGCEGFGTVVGCPHPGHKMADMVGQYHEEEYDE